MNFPKYITFVNKVFVNRGHEPRPDDARRFAEMGL